MEGVERRRNADFPLPFFFRMNLFVAVAHMEFVAFPEKVAVTKRYLLFFQKK